MKHGKKLILGFYALMATLPAAVHAQMTSDPDAAGSGTVKLTNPLGVESVPQLAGNIIGVAVGMVGAVALLIFVYGGLLWLTSGGAADKVNKGKQVMVWAVIGLLIIFSSAALVRFVFGAFSK